MYTILPSPILKMVSGLRFQPLVNLHTAQVVAHEVLLEIPDINLEVFISSLPSCSTLHLFFWQANTLLQMPGRNYYWLNLPAEHLLDERAINLMLALPHQCRLTIEIQDPLAIVLMSETEQRLLHATLRRLKDSGWKIWLDDLNRGLAEDYLRLALPLDGVKIDRTELSMHSQLTSFIDFVRAGIAEFIVIEGIENSEALERAYMSGAQFGQGFLWPENRIDAGIT